MFHFDPCLSKNYIPKLTKEKELLRQRIIESGVLMFFVDLMLTKNKLEIEIKQ